MNIHFPFSIIPVLASFAMAGNVHASCRADTPEIGDIGPDGEVVCAALAHDFPRAEIQLYNRKIIAMDHVIVAAQIDDKPYSIDYRLVNADWIKSHGPCLAGL